MAYSAMGKEGPFVILEAVNDGEKPVTLISIHIMVRGARKRMYIKSSLPRKLNEGDSFMQQLSRKELLESLKDLRDDPPWKCTVVFYSNSGRKYTKGVTFAPDP